MSLVDKWLNVSRIILVSNDVCAWVDDRCLHVASCTTFATNVNQICQYEINHCYPHWMCSTWGGS